MTSLNLSFYYTAAGCSLTGVSSERRKTSHALHSIEHIQDGVSYLDINILLNEILAFGLETFIL